MKAYLALALSIISLTTLADEQDFNECIVEYMKYSDKQTTAESIIDYCEQASNKEPHSNQQRQDVVENKQKMESLTRENPYVITPYQPNSALFS